MPSGAKVTPPKLNGRSEVLARPCHVPETFVAQPVAIRQPRVIKIFAVRVAMIGSFQRADGLH